MELARNGDTDTAYPVEVVALFLHSASASSLCFGIWRVFHPDRRWAFYLCVATSALLFDSWMAVILPGQHSSVTGFTNWFHLHVASRAFASAWGASAALLHHRRLRRRLALGLVDRFTCHRFGLWGFALALHRGHARDGTRHQHREGRARIRLEPRLVVRGRARAAGCVGALVRVPAAPFYRRLFEASPKAVASDGLA